MADNIDNTLLRKKTSDQIWNPIPSFSFVLQVEAAYFLALRSVHVFNKENEYEYIREGGVNDYVHMKRKPISKPFTFQIERYVGTDQFIDPLANGTVLMAPLILYVYRTQARQGIMPDNAGKAWPARIYTFTGCTVISKEYGELNAEKSGILTETTTIAYRELVVVTNPFNDSAENKVNEAIKAKPDQLNKTYKKDEKGSITRIDSGELNRPKPKSITAEYKAPYKKGENGTVRGDGAPYNRPAPTKIEAQVKDPYYIGDGGHMYRKASGADKANALSSI